jgi:hypothetical protein
MPNRNPANPKYRVSLKLASNTYTRIAPSIVEALERMRPEHMSKAKAVITVSSKRVKRQIVLFPIQTKRLFANRIAREIFQKRMIGAFQ